MNGRQKEIIKGIASAVWKRSVVIGFGLLAVVIIGNQLAGARYEAEQRDKQTEQVLQSIKQENDHQTQIIRDQFQVLCVLIINTSGPQALSQLDPSTEQKCRDLLAGKHINQPSQAASEPSKSSTQSNTHTKSQSPRTAAQTTPDKQSQPRKPAQPAQPYSVSKWLGGWLNLILGR